MGIPEDGASTLSTPEGKQCTPIKIVDVPKGKLVALCDLDGTMTTPGDHLLIEQFNRDVQVGALHVREKLLTRFDQWEQDRKSGVADYEQFLTDVGNYWAQMLGEGKARRSDVMERADRWFQETGSKQLMDYSRDVIKSIDSRNIRNVMTTGAPFEVASHFGKHLGIEYVFAMQAEVDPNGQYTGRMLHNTGLNRAKVKVRENLSEQGHRIILGIGDTPADGPLFRGAIEMHHPNDVRGKAVLINARKEIIVAAESWLREWIDAGALIIIPQHRAKDAIVNDIRHTIDDALRNNGLTTECAQEQDPAAGT